MKHERVADKASLVVEITTRLWAAASAERVLVATSASTSDLSWLGGSRGEFHEAFVKHRQGTSLKELSPKVEVQNYEQFAQSLTWAERHLAESDSVHLIPLPDGEMPDLRFEEWEEWQRRNSPLDGQTCQW